jgi:hypothetical protein
VERVSLALVQPFWDFGLFYLWLLELLEWEVSPGIEGWGLVLKSFAPFLLQLQTPLHFVPVPVLGCFPSLVLSQDRVVVLNEGEVLVEKLDFVLNFLSHHLLEELRYVPVIDVLIEEPNLQDF